MLLEVETHSRLAWALSNTQTEDVKEGTAASIQRLLITGVLYNPAKYKGFVFFSFLDVSFLMLRKNKIKGTENKKYCTLNLGPEPGGSEGVTRGQGKLADFLSAP